MTNDEIQMTKEARSGHFSSFVIWISSFLRHLNFVIPSSFEFRHSSIPVS